MSCALVQRREPGRKLSGMRSGDVCGLFTAVTPACPENCWQGRRMICCGRGLIYTATWFIPAGAVPTAVISAITGKAVHKEFAMTGELTLRGKVLPVGGIREKVLAAHRAGCSKIILPRENEKDIEEIPMDIRKELEFYPVTTLQQVLELALVEV